MQNRITVTYTCNHKGKLLDPVIEKFWDSCPPPARVCYCLPDPEREHRKIATPMNYRVEVEETKPE